MDLHPKLIAAADMCEAGEEVNLDEIAYLLRYAVDELQEQETAVPERDRLLERLRRRVLARCELLDRGEVDCARAREGSLEELERLDDELDREFREHFPGGVSLPPVSESRLDPGEVNRYRSGR